MVAFFIRGCGWLDGLQGLSRARALRSGLKLLQNSDSGWRELLLQNARSTDSVAVV